MELQHCDKFHGGIELDIRNPTCRGNHCPCNEGARFARSIGVSTYDFWQTITRGSKL